MSAPAIAIEGLEVRAGRKPILGPLDLEVAEGEHALVVGPSGCGKTTLLRAVAGLARARRGRVSLFGEPVSDGPRLRVPPAARRIGFLFQGGALWPHMSVQRTLRFVMLQAGSPRREHASRVARLLELVDLQGFERRKPGTLSGGEGQRLALARALATDPRLLLLDEPLGPLDADRREGLLTRLHAVQEELELTVLHVTHDPGEARRVAGRTLRMNAGLVVSSESHREEVQT